MRWIALSLSVFVATIAVLWMIFVQAPNPAQVCEHKVALTLAEAQGLDAGPLLEQLKVGCVKSAQSKIKMRGRIKYANYAKCVMAATDLESAERCSTGS